MRDGRTERIWLLLLAGFAAGMMAGLFGIGGGVLMIPPLVLWFGQSQHQAHATSLAAIIPIAAMGAARFAVAGEVDLAAAGLMSVGTLVGAPLGAKIMSGTSEGALKIAFGIFAVAIGGFLAWS